MGFLRVIGEGNKDIFFKTKVHFVYKQGVGMWKKQASVLGMGGRVVRGEGRVHETHQSMAHIQ